MSETLRYYDNPYSSTKDKVKYQMYYYSYTKKLLSHDDCIQYSIDEEFRNKCKTYKSRKTRAQLLKDQKPIYHYSDAVDDSYDKERIIDENKWYVFYSNKVYSKLTYKYLSIHQTKIHGKFCVLNSGDYHKYKYKLK